MTRSLPKSHPCLMMFAACREAGLPPPLLLPARVMLCVTLRCSALHWTELLSAIRWTRISLTTAVTCKAPPQTCKLPTDNTPTFRKQAKFIPIRPSLSFFKFIQNHSTIASILCPSIYPPFKGNTRVLWIFPNMPPVLLHVCLISSFFGWIKICPYFIETPLFKLAPLDDVLAFNCLVLCFTGN